MASSYFHVIISFDKVPGGNVKSGYSGIGENESLHQTGKILSSECIEFEC